MVYHSLSIYLFMYRRLTSKDLKKKDNGTPTPDFYALSRENPLPESIPVAATSLTPPAIANANAAALAASAAGRADFAQSDVAELALLERKRAEIVNRMSLLAGSNQFGAQGQLGQQGMNNNSLYAAAALSLGNNGPGAGVPFQQNFMGGMPMGMPGMGNFLGDPNNAAALQRQLLEARLANVNMAQLLGLNNGQMPQQQQQNQMQQQQQPQQNQQGQQQQQPQQPPQPQQNQQVQQEQQGGDGNGGVAAGVGMPGQMMPQQTN